MFSALIAAQAGEPLVRLAIAWNLASPAITSVILGASRAEQLRDTLTAADYALPASVKAEFDEVTIEYLRGDAGK